MMGNGKMENIMALAYFNGLMDQHIKENGATARKMAVVNFKVKVELFMKVNGLTESITEEENCLHTKERFLLACLKMGNL